MTEWWVIALLVVVLLLIKPVTYWVIDQYNKWRNKHYSVDQINKRERYVDWGEVKWR